MSPLHITRILLLISLAIALGVAVLVMDASRRGQRGYVAAATNIASPAQRTVLQAAPEVPGALVAGGAAATAAPALLPATEEVIERRGGVACAAPHRTVQITESTAIRAAPGGRVVGTVPATSKYLGSSTTAWLLAVSADGAWGKLTIPWGRSVGAAGWISLEAASLGSNRTLVVADLSDRTLRVYRGCDEILSVPTAVGAAGSPSPRGRFWVTDRIVVPRSQPTFGSFAFGLSTIQPNTPVGWTGGNQMAIHGTNAPGSIGTAASAGCLRVSESTLARLKPYLPVGTPVVIQA